MLLNAIWSQNGQQRDQLVSQTVKVVFFTCVDELKSVNETTSQTVRQNRQHPLLSARVFECLT